MKHLLPAKHCYKPRRFHSEQTNSCPHRAYVLRRAQKANRNNSQLPGMLEDPECWEKNKVGKETGSGVEAGLTEWWHLSEESGFHHPEKELEGSVVLAEWRGRAVGDVVRQGKGGQNRQDLAGYCKDSGFHQEAGGRGVASGDFEQRSNIISLAFLTFFLPTPFPKVLGLSSNYSNIELTS